MLELPAMRDIHSAATPSNNPPYDQVVTKFDKLGLPLQIIESGGRPATIFFYGADGERQTSEKESPP